jgi:hypothetical protein
VINSIQESTILRGKTKQNPTTITTHWWCTTTHLPVRQQAVLFLCPFVTTITGLCVEKSARGGGNAHASLGKREATALLPHAFYM